MKSNNYLLKTFGFLLTLSLLLIVSPTISQTFAQGYNNGDRHYQEDSDYYRPVYNYGRYNFTEADARQVGSLSGYSEGYQQGVAARRSCRNFNFTNDSVYRDATYGYRSEFRHKDNYKKGFRYGYELGYRDAYNGYRYRRDFARNSYNLGYYRNLR